MFQDVDGYCKTWEPNIPIMPPNSIRKQETSVTSKKNSLCCFTASSKENEVPDSKHVSGRAVSEKLSSERTKKQHIFLEWKLPQHISGSIRNYFKSSGKVFLVSALIYITLMPYDVLLMSE